MRYRWLSITAWAAMAVGAAAVGLAAVSAVRDVVADAPVRVLTASDVDRLLQDPESAASTHRDAGRGLRPRAPRVAGRCRRRAPSPRMRSWWRPSRAGGRRSPPRAHPPRSRRRVRSTGGAWSGHRIHVRTGERCGLGRLLIDRPDGPHAVSDPGARTRPSESTGAHARGVGAGDPHSGPDADPDPSDPTPSLTPTDPTPSPSETSASPTDPSPSPSEPRRPSPSPSEP